MAARVATSDASKHDDQQAAVNPVGATNLDSLFQGVFPYALSRYALWTLPISGTLREIRCIWVG